MFRFVVLSALLAVAYAAPQIAYGAYAHAPFSYPAPVAYSAPVVKAALPVATSYANTYKVAVKSPVIAAPVAYAAPAAYHAPVVAAAPAYHAPVVAAAPAYASYASPYAHTYIH